MKDLTEYSDQELSLIVFNDDYFYNERNNTSYLMALINEEFIYNDNQKENLIESLASDYLENYTESQFDIDSIIFDIENNNFDLDLLMEYRKEAIVLISLFNGQIKQAKEQCKEYKLDYGHMITKFNYKIGIN